MFTATGYLNLVQQEGGYAGPDWELDGSGLARIVSEHFGVKRVLWSDDWRELPHSTVPGDIPIGRVRITIERIEAD